VVQLSPKDSSILTRIARYGLIPIDERRKLLNEASAKAREIGEIILGTSTDENADEETKAAVAAYRRSFQGTQRTGKRRRLRRKRRRSRREVAV
jgi:hypothetical protein